MRRFPPPGQSICGLSGDILALRTVSQGSSNFIFRASFSMLTSWSIIPFGPTM